MTYTYLVGQHVVDSLTNAVGFAVGVDPQTNATMARYVAGGIPEILGQTAKSLGIDQKHLGRKESGQGKTLSDWVHPTYLAA